MPPSFETLASQAPQDEEDKRKSPADFPAGLSIKAR
jgi:hypothetical protein